MNPALTMSTDGKKFMWDGRLYDTRNEQSREAEAYEKVNFEVRLVEQGGKFLIYTRRVAKEIAGTVP